MVATEVTSLSVIQRESYPLNIQFTGVRARFVAETSNIHLIQMGDEVAVPVMYFA